MTDANLVGAIDQGTSSTRFLIFSNATGSMVCQHQQETKNVYPKEGWCEQDPFEILSSTLTCIKEACQKLKEKNISIDRLKAIGITNQRESTIVWSQCTGQPLHPAIIWLDGRTAKTVDRLVDKTDSKDKNAFQKICGLPLSTYFSAVKYRWLLDNIPAVREAVDQDDCLFGTVDTWLLWNLTGGVKGGVHATDVTNASRTMLMNLQTLHWDDGMCDFFGINKSTLPAVRSSSEIFGHMKEGPLTGVPISGILGDQQAALVGQKCFQQGTAKNTYGTGNFLLYNTGNKAVFSQHGLLTTVGYQLGKDQPVKYALEGSIAITGAAITWLRDNMGIIKSASETEDLAKSVSDNGDVYFIPAFSGLFAPYWDTSARGCIVGLTQFSTRAHIVRATLEAVCFQTRELLDAMNSESGIPLKHLLVDGGMTANNFLMKLQADILGISVVRAAMAETTALGAAIAAATAEGVGCWPDVTTDGTDASTMDTRATTFSPNLDEPERKRLYDRWLEAIEKSRGWHRK